MSELKSLVEHAQQGDASSYDALVRRFQDMAVGYAFSLLGDFQHAEDAAQEAFLEAAISLHALREPAAFPGWLRAIVFKQCDRQKRKSRIATVALEIAAEAPDCGMLPQRHAEVKELKEQVRRAIASLPQHERAATLLFYLSEYSQAEVADFLGIPVTTVKKRLHSARQRLKKEMIEMVKDELQEQRPSKDDEFIQRFREIVVAVSRGDASKVRDLLQSDPALLNAKGRDYAIGEEETYPLLVAAYCNQQEIAEFLLEQGADPHVASNGYSALKSAAFHQNHELADALLARGVPMDIWIASALGDAEKVRAFLRESPELINARDDNGATPLHIAGNAEIAQILLDAGADIEAKNSVLGNTPVERTDYGRRSSRDVVDLLIAKGAKVPFWMACSLRDLETTRRFLQDDPSLASTFYYEGGRPDGGTFPISGAATRGDIEMVALLLEYGADVDTPNPDYGNTTPLQYAAYWGRPELAAFLLERGAKVFGKNSWNETPLSIAMRQLERPEDWKWWISQHQQGKEHYHLPRHQEVIELLRRHGATE